MPFPRRELVVDASALEQMVALIRLLPTSRYAPEMRALIAACTSIAIVAGAACSADEGNLLIRCPGLEGAIAVSNGAVTVETLALRVSADLATPAAAQEGMTFTIEIRLPDSPAHVAPSVDCVRVDKPSNNSRWDARPYGTEQSSDGTVTIIRAKGDHGPHWPAGDAVDVTVWISVAGHRHPLTVGRQPIHP